MSYRSAFFLLLGVFVLHFSRILFDGEVIFPHDNSFFHFAASARFFLIHYAGVGCEMETIIAVARRHGIVVVEDNAHGLYGKYRDTAECPATKAALWVC